MTEPKLRTTIIREAKEDLAKRTTRSASLIIVVANDTGRVLVVGRKKDGQVGLPCGKDDGDGAINTVFRELWEETGVAEAQLNKPVYYYRVVEFEGVLISIFSATIDKEIDVKPAKGFEDETEPYWITVPELVKTESHFQTFNIVALNMAGLY